MASSRPGHRLIDRIVACCAPRPGDLEMVVGIGLLEAFGRSLTNLRGRRCIADVLVGSKQVPLKHPFHLSVVQVSRSRAIETSL